MIKLGSVWKTYGSSLKPSMLLAQLTEALFGRLRVLLTKLGHEDLEIQTSLSSGGELLEG